MFMQTSIKAVKTSARVQNAAYSSLQNSDPVLNGNEPTFLTRQEKSEERRYNDRGSLFSVENDANSETCTEL